MAKDIEITTIYTNSDNTEGKGHSVEVAHFTHHRDAVQVCKDERFYRKYGVMGTPLDPRYAVKNRTIHVYESAQEYWDQHDEYKRRQRALDKLTDDDKRVLGLI